MFNKHRQETIIYMVLWGILFIAPLMSLYIRSTNGHSFDWSEVMMVWRQYGLFFAIFLIHNHLLAPLLVYKQRKALYLSIAATLVALFAVYQCSTEPAKKDRHGPRHEMRAGHRPPAFGDKEPPELGDKEPPAFPSPLGEPEGGHLRETEGLHRPPVFIGQHDVIAVIVLILMLTANLGIKLYFRNERDRKRLNLLEKENLEQQLEYLRYQINPHFFMNTLNNIHALVDIDPEKAQETILELSRMMRFVLYEGNKQTVPLTREMDFIRTYVKLMQLRFTDKVHITLDLPTEVPDRSLPPLLLITFIENAFKHGVSYQHDSFIEVRVEVADNKLHFSCINSKVEKPNDEKGGVGLDNVRKRLGLLYGSDYTLRLLNHPDSYHVYLEIPL